MNSEEFTSLLDQAVAAADQLAELDTPQAAALSAPAFVVAASRIAGFTEDQARELRDRIDSDRTLEHLAGAIDGGASFIAGRHAGRCPHPPTDVSRLRWLFSEDARSEMARIGANELTCFAVSAVVASERFGKYPESFGTCEDPIAHHRTLTEARARFEALCDRLESETPISALTITAPDQPSLREQGLFHVAYSITDGAVSIGQGSGHALVVWHQAQRVADQVATPEAA